MNTPTRLKIPQGSSYILLHELHSWLLKSNYMLSREGIVLMEGRGNIMGLDKLLELLVRTSVLQTC